ncbi:UNVERIFIED_CONTAM: Pentatricopeptide repeat-containing protein, mitochondrial [Sesamum latifolium]|uniref:Pentatricopeptide repeat-containing protein, mitochondrial n=1 Tax=Sesamum latifolium TaxID=2727402 RepID=A0AAW2UVM7_9LAMI
MDQNKSLCPPWHICNYIGDVVMQSDNSKLTYYALEFMAKWIARGENASPAVLLSLDEGLVVSALGTAGRTYNSRLLDGSWAALKGSLRQKKRRIGNDSIVSPDTSFTAFLYSLSASSESRSNSNFKEKIDSDDNPFKPSSEPTVIRENTKKKSLFSRGKQSLGKAIYQAAKLGGFRNQGPKGSSDMAVGNGSNSKISGDKGIPMLQTLNESVSSENLPETSEPSLLLREKTRTILYAALPVIVQGRKWMLLCSNLLHYPILFPSRCEAAYFDTRSHQSRVGPDPHDDFLGTPLENVSENLGKVMEEDQTNSPKLVPINMRLDNSDDETQDMDVDGGQENPNTPTKAGKIC